MGCIRERGFTGGVATPCRQKRFPPAGAARRRFRPLSPCENPPPPAPSYLSHAPDTAPAREPPRQTCTGRLPPSRRQACLSTEPIQSLSQFRGTVHRWSSLHPLERPVLMP